MVSTRIAKSKVENPRAKDSASTLTRKKSVANVSVDGGILTVTAQRSERTEHDVQWLSSERFTGSYLRRLSLGPDIDADHIAATYHNGVLTVTLPVAAKAQPRHIEITPGGREETQVIEPSDSSDQHTTT